MEHVRKYADEMQELCIDNDCISKNLFSEFNVKRGLRDEKGKGILTGLTNISQIRAFENKGGRQIPCDGQLLYRGYDIRDLVAGGEDNRFLFEEGAYLLLFGELPSRQRLQEFQKIFSCSLRMGELLGLTWDCVDISPKAISETVQELYLVTA